jgi:hypothetical protein
MDYRIASNGDVYRIEAYINGRWCAVMGLYDTREEASRVLRQVRQDDWYEVEED